VWEDSSKVLLSRGRNTAVADEKRGRLQDDVEHGEEFTRFVRKVEPRLRRALIATYGRERGREATAEALGWAWETWPRAEEAKNPVALLYRVGQSRSRRHKLRSVFERPVSQEVYVEPGLAQALSSLSQRQRTVVLLVQGAGWTQAEAAAVLGLKLSTVQKHVERALDHLRQALQVEPSKGKEA
jgi:DNA-directed RNA polymerase specialized sigma24 family protein